MKAKNNNHKIKICVEKETFEGVKRVADKVLEDFKEITGDSFERIETDSFENLSDCIFVATVGNSTILDSMTQQGLVDIEDVRGKREVYKIVEYNDSLIVIGSDKRGTIYGLYSVSESLGVSPWHYFADVPTPKSDNFEIPKSVIKTSKEPSVRYRGFFINDEWPSFGGWTTEKFGGWTSEMYDHVFDLLLRLKGNYLWPAMWSSSFTLDGPGEANMELADIYGVVFCFSHHEPCLRSSEEWDKVKGDDSIYGKEWNYYLNRDGLINYWRDGLKRGGKYENYITIGMRGERDSSMLGDDATIAENVELLKDIIKNQNELIKEYVNPDLSKTRRMLALYKEVEAYYYGDATYEGLKDYDELEDVTFLLCEDNFGNMRTLPTEADRNHKGGYGMYYHFDYHGGPVSYEWVNSTPLVKVWEQMSMAYEFGIREIWVVNVGDIKPQEIPLSFFMDLAYDYEKYGANCVNETGKYLEKLVEGIFGRYFEKDDLSKIRFVIDEYTKINGMRRPEVMNKDIYSVTAFKEAERMLERNMRLKEIANELKSSCEEEIYPAFFELVYFPAVASANVQIMGLCAGLNEYYAQKNCLKANEYEKRVQEAILLDNELTDLYHGVNNGKWNKMMSSNHVGFVNWNDVGWSYPEVTHVYNGVEDIEVDEPVCDYAVYEAGDFVTSVKCEDSEIKIIEGYGKTENTAKSYPFTKSVKVGEVLSGNYAHLVYEYEADEEGDYELILYVNPTNALYPGDKQRIAVGIENGLIAIKSTFPEDFNGGSLKSESWCRNVLDNIRYVSFILHLKKGINRIEIGAVDAGVMYERFTITRKGDKLPYSYLGPVKN